MKIALLAESVKDEPIFGTSVYAHNLIKGLIQQKEDLSLIYLDPPKINGFTGSKVRSYRFCGLPFPGQKIADWRLLKIANEYDVLHDPSGNDMPLGCTKSKKIITLHSLGPLESPQYFKERHVRAWDKVRLIQLQEADAIIVVTDYEKENLLRWFPDLNKNKVYPVMLGVDPKIFNPDRKGVDSPLSRPYILYVGAISPAKGLLDLVKSFARICDRIPHYLCLVGAEWLGTEQVLKEISKLGLKDRILWYGAISHDELPRYYANADVTVQVSYYETYCLPILEAMACGSPVITSNILSLKRMYGDMTMQFQTGDQEAIAEAIVRVLSDKTSRINLIANGLKYAQAHTWKSTVEQTIRVYREVCQVA